MFKLTSGGKTWRIQADFQVEVVDGCCYVKAITHNGNSITVYGSFSIEEKKKKKKKKKK